MEKLNIDSYTEMVNDLFVKGAVSNQCRDTNLFTTLSPMYQATELKNTLSEKDYLFKDIKIVDLQEEDWYLDLRRCVAVNENIDRTSISSSVQVIILVNDGKVETLKDADLLDDLITRHRLEGKLLKHNTTIHVYSSDSNLPDSWTNMCDSYKIVV